MIANNRKSRSWRAGFFAALVALSPSSPAAQRSSGRTATAPACDLDALASSLESLSARTAVGVPFGTSEGVLLRALDCNPEDGNVRLRLLPYEIRGLASGPVTQSLQHTLETGFWTESRLALIRWVVMSAPPNGLLLMQGDDDAVPAWTLQSVEGIRPDVTVIHTGWLGNGWYGDPRGERASEPRAQGSSIADEKDRILDELVAADSLGTLGRPLVASVTLDPSVLGSRATGVVDGAAVSWASAASRYDLGAAARSVALLNGSHFAGPNVSAQDREPRRRAFPAKLGSVPLFHALQVAVSYAQAGDAAAAETFYSNALAFAEASGQSDDFLIPTARQWIDDALAAHE